MALAPDDLLGPLATRNAVASARVVTNERLRDAQDLVINMIVAAGGIVPNTGTVVGLPNDGWGKAVVYNPILPPLASVCGSPAGATAYSLTSLGIDGAAGPNAANSNFDDDIAVTQTVDRIKTLILASGAGCP